MTQISRRHYLAASGALLTAAFAPRAALAQTTIRQGYQTNLWGMPTYYLMRSGLLEKRGIKAEEFAVPSGNLTMQQMVARQVDLGTYAGPSLILGHDKGGLVAIAQIEHVGKTASVMVRKDLSITKVSELKGMKIANQTGSSIGNVFVDQIAPAAGAIWSTKMLPIDDPVWLAILRPLSCSTLLMLRSLRAMMRVVRPTCSMTAMPMRPPLSWPRMKEGPA